MQAGGLSLRASPNGEHLTYISEGTQVLITQRATEKVGDYYWDKVSTPKGTGYMARGSSTKVWLVVINQGNNGDNNQGDNGDNNQEIIQTNCKIEGAYIIVVPGATIGHIIGGTTESTVFGTGAKINLQENNYDLVMLGDVSGDGKTSPADYVRVKNKIMGVTSMDAVTEKAADVNRDGKVSPADYVQIKNHIMDVKKISL